MKPLTEEEQKRARDFLSFAVVGLTEQGGRLVANLKTHMLYDFDGMHFIPLFEKYEDNFSTPIEEIDGFVKIGLD